MAVILSVKRVIFCFLSKNFSLADNINQSIMLASCWEIDFPALFFKHTKLTVTGTLVCAVSVTHRDVLLTYYGLCMLYAWNIFVDKILLVCLSHWECWKLLFSSVLYMFSDSWNSFSESRFWILCWAKNSVIKYFLHSYIFDALLSLFDFVGGNIFYAERKVSMYGYT